jgi:hypothetical protein
MEINYNQDGFDKMYYYIYINYNDYNYYDYDIMDLLNISCIEYKQIIKMFNGIKCDVLKFNKIEQCEKCINYIKQNYNDKLIYLKLTENKFRK